MAQAYISLSSNLGDRVGFIEKATEALRGAGTVYRVSSFYKTEPWGIKKQPWFMNVCLEMETALTPEALLQTCLDIEKKLGRVRQKKWGPRIIDIDILFYDSQIVDSDTLYIPHPEISKRRFVLAPLAEIAPDFHHPILKKSIKELLKECPDPSIVKLGLRSHWQSQMLARPCARAVRSQ